MILVVISVLIWLYFVTVYVVTAIKTMRKNDRSRDDAVAEFAKRVRYIRYLEAVPKKDCERHNHQKRLRGVLTLAKLCIDCQYELKLRTRI